MTLTVRRRWLAAVLILGFARGSAWPQLRLHSMALGGALAGVVDGALGLAAALVLAAPGRAG
jgi:hypothetical protein